MDTQCPYRRKKVLLVMPDGRIHRMRLGPFVKSMREVPLSLATLAALVPEDAPFDLELIDESVGEDPLGREADLVGVSVMTGTAPRAYEIAGHYRRAGVPVVLGGVHATLLPEEAALHCDSVVTGSAETAFPRLLEDFARGSLAPRYTESAAAPGAKLRIPSPRTELHTRRRYMIPNTVFATRGCRHSCDFCSAAALYKGYARRPVEHVLRDIRRSRRGFFLFNDVSLLDDVEYAKELLSAIVPLKRKWAGLGTVEVADDPELLDLLRRSGCRGLLVGFESTRGRALGEIHKSCNTARDYKRVVDLLHDASVSVQGTFMFGFDSDRPEVFDETVERIEEIGIDIPRFSILTPHPGTRLFDKLLAEGRILSFDWSDYDTMHVVFEPAGMTPEELFDGFKRAYRRAFELPRIARRLRGFGVGALIGLLGNLTYRRFSRALFENEIYARAYTPGAGLVPTWIPTPAKGAR